jgi:hypothetical protein
MGKGMMLLRLGAILMLLVVLGFWVTGHAQTAALQGQSGSASQQQEGNAAVHPNQRAQNTNQEKDQRDEQAKNEEDDNEKPAKKHTHVHLGMITVGASYTNFGHAFVGPYYPYPYPYYPYGAFSVGAFYTPFAGYPFYDPFYYPAYGPVLKYAPGKGEVKLSSLGHNKNAEVYIDNAYAGIAGKLKEMWLDPGAYDLSLKAADGSSFTKRIYVLSGKSLKITPEFQMAEKVPGPEEKR